jgi:alpha-L-glutamate ligase-like protein
MLGHLRDYLGDRDDFVIKPNRGSAGRGVLVVVGRAGKNYLRHNGEFLRPELIRQHLSDILSGMYSLGGRPDRAMVQQRIRLHPAFASIAYKGIPDIRVILYRNRPAMAMLRLPTRASNGRANLHQGGIGAGVDLQTGITNHAVQRNRFVECHPDTGISVVGMRVPYWRAVLDMSRRVAEATGLGYLGVDIVVDAAQGPMLLEANARPGLAIQIANGRGLLPRLKEIDQELEQDQDATEPQPGVVGKVGQVYRQSA